MTDYPEELAVFMPGFEDEITNLYVDYIIGAITLEEWHTAMKALLARKFIQAWTLGGAVLTDAVMQDLSIQLGSQLGYLQGFVGVLASTEDVTPFVSRAVSYAAAVVDPFWQSKTFGLPLPTYPGAGDTECKQWCRCKWDIKWIDRTKGDADAYWKLGKAEHCPTCLERADQWNPLRIRGGMLQ